MVFNYEYKLELIFEYLRVIQSKTTFWHFSIFGIQLEVEFFGSFQIFMAKHNLKLYALPKLSFFSQVSYLDNPLFSLPT